MVKTLVSRTVLAASVLMAGSAMAADIEAGRTAANACAACHGMDGNSSNPAFPSLAGQGKKYLIKQLEDYRSGARANPIMAPQAQGLSDDDIVNLAAFYAAQTPSYQPQGEGSDAGAALYMYGQPENGIAACAACHGPAGHGNAPAAYPRLRSLSVGYLTESLRGYRDGSRNNDLQKIMREVSENLSDEQIDALAAHIAAMP